MLTPERTAEAIKLLMDWNKWLVTVQTAAIAALGFLARPSDIALLNDRWGLAALMLGTSSTLCFVACIVLASYLLLFLPVMAEQLPPNGALVLPSQLLFHRPVPFAPGWQVGTYTTWQSRLFVTGIGSFGLTFLALAMRGLH